MGIIQIGHQQEKGSVVGPTLAWLHVRRQILKNRGVFSQTSAGHCPMCADLPHSSAEVISLFAQWSV